MDRELKKSSPEFDFKYLKRKLNSSIVPSSQWSYTKGYKDFIGVQKIENDCSIRKRVAVLSNMHVEIYFDNKIVPLTQFIILESMEHLIALLESIDEMSVRSD